jgi:hypothetical protein
VVLSVTVMMFDVSICRVTTVLQTETVEPSFATPAAVSVYSATLAYTLAEPALLELSTTVECVLLEPSAVAMFLVATVTNNALPTVIFADGPTPIEFVLAVAVAEPRTVTAEKAMS